ncbi:radical SAM protein [Actinosynnema sp. NPDC050436]|uniref:B12-binding domain-containing radical SAM protein n=1 Tax=Actinosynnema sp. NPDC050436 TaxID=3155659 RepID=UPI0033C81680
MRVLLMSGLGPAELHETYLEGSLFQPSFDERAREMLRRAGLPELSLDQFAFEHAGTRYGLLRPASNTMPPHLTTVTLQSILESSGHSYDMLGLDGVWTGTAVPPAGDFDLVLLSTTFIWNPQILDQAIRWITDNLPGTRIIAGGQYTNLKYMPAMNHHPEIVAVIRGDSEQSLPMTLDAMEKGAFLGDIPNLVWREDRRIRINPIEYIDIDGFPSPSVLGNAAIVPYESMRGCPFDCKFCSFPAASPKWRYKSAEKIRDDWQSYAKLNGASLMYAMDSTFTIPPTRLRKLLEILPQSDTPPWDGFSRANTIDSEAVVEKLAAARCRRLYIGFESMNDATLKRMSKRVSAKQNRKAAELLSDSDVTYSIFFIAGYPGETPEMYQDTLDYLVEEFVGHYYVNKFSISDENMPLWEDREELKIVATDPTDTLAPWSHIGMDSVEAARLQTETLDKVRARSETAVMHAWQDDYQHWLMPQNDRRANIAVEKCVERLGMAPVDYPDLDEGAHAMRTQVDRLRDLGVAVAPESRELCRDAI